MTARIVLDGVDDLRVQLRRLPPIAQRRVLRPAILAGAQFLRRAIRQAAPRGPTGNLKRGVTIEAPAFDVEAAVVEVGWRRGRRGAGHAHLVEKGTASRRTRKGASRGAAKANPFFEEAVSLAFASAAVVIRTAWATRLALAARQYKAGAFARR